MRDSFDGVEYVRTQIPGYPKTKHGDRFGCFVFREFSGTFIRCIVDDGAETGWEHVSVTVRDPLADGCDRTPTWEEMAKVKEHFWRPNETVVQFHPDRQQYVNFHPYTLHLWKRVGHDYELPPNHLIGPIDGADNEDAIR